MDQQANAVRKEQWRRIVTECINRDPQISKRKWCEDNGIKFRSFTYWQHKFRMEALEQMDSRPATTMAVTSPSCNPGFVDMTAQFEALQPIREEALQGKEDLAAAPELMIQTGNYRIYVNGTVQMSTLEKVMKVLSHA